MRLYRWTVVFVLCLVGVATDAAAQTTTDERLWAGLTIQTRPREASPWRFSFEALARTRDGVDTLDVFGVRFLAGYAVTPRITASAGYAISPSYPATGGTSIEQRAFGQIVFATPAAGGTLTLRSRVEARFSEGDSGTAVRIRQQVRFTRPIAGRFGWVVYDELFVHTTETTRFARGIDQNRAFAGISIAVSSAAKLETGYLHAFSPENRGAAAKRYHVLFVGLGLVF